LFNDPDPERVPKCLDVPKTAGIAGVGSIGLVILSPAALRDKLFLSTT